MSNQPPDQCFTQRISDDSRIETLSDQGIVFPPICVLPSKRGLNRLEKQIHLLMGRDAGNDESEVATPGCSRIVDKRRINAVLY